MKMSTWLHCLTTSPLFALDFLAHVHVEMFIVRAHITHLLSQGPLCTICVWREGWVGVFQITQKKEKADCSGRHNTNSDVDH